MKYIKSYNESIKDKVEQWENIEMSLSTLVEEFGFHKKTDSIYTTIHNDLLDPIELTDSLYSELVKINKRIISEGKELYLMILDDEGCVPFYSEELKSKDRLTNIDNLSNRITTGLFGSNWEYYKLNSLIESHDLEHLVSENLDMELVII